MSNEDVADLRKILQAHEKRISDLESLLKHKPHQAGKEVAIKEFILDKNRRLTLARRLSLAIIWSVIETFHRLR